jgi:hypothetical protein
VSIRVGINGFGRIGRLTFRAIYEKYGLNGDVQVVALNDLTDAKTNAHLLEFDSNYGPFKGQVGYDGNDIVVDGKKIKVFAERDPGAIPWGTEDVQIVVESTGFFTDATKAVAHKRDSVKKVVISAPAKNEDLTIVLGVNDSVYDAKKHHVISNASCTTNGLAPVAKVLHEAYGIDRGLLTTVHAYTNSQKTVDTAAKDLRDARAAALNIVPSSTGGAGDSRTAGQVHRHGLPRADADSERGGLHGPAQQRRRTGRHQRRDEEGSRGPAQGHSPLHRQRAGIDGPEGRSAQFDLLGGRHDRPWQLREGGELVRQRVGLLQSRRRPAQLPRRPRAVEARVKASLGSRAHSPTIALWHRCIFAASGWTPAVMHGCHSVGTDRVWGERLLLSIRFFLLLSFEAFDLFVSGL